MTASSIVVKKKIRICVLDNVRTVCNNRTNVRGMRGETNMDQTRAEGNARQQMIEMLLHATDEEAMEILEEIRSFRERASYQEKTADLRD